jgi:dihydrodipicolinate synthase/N-acetylneuraminate lyase
MVNGATAVLIAPPFYYKNVSDSGVIAWYTSLVHNIGADLRVVFYHFPAMTGVPITENIVRSLRSEHPGVFVGLKDSSGNFENTKAMIEVLRRSTRSYNRLTLISKSSAALRNSWVKISRQGDTAASVRLQTSLWKYAPAALQEERKPQPLKLL